MSYKITILKEDDFVTSNWSGGKTTQMYIYPENSIYKNLDFKWRISSASVELLESDFTELKNVHRFITTLDNDLKLTHNFNDFINVKPFEIYEFDGAIKTHSYGKVNDFNLMLANGATGRLESLIIQPELSLSLINGNINEQYEIFYSYNEDLTLIIANDEIELNKNELLIIKLDENDLIDIKIKSNSAANVLHATLME